MSTRRAGLLRLAPTLLLAWAACTQAAGVEFTFASAAQGGTVLATQDDYVRAVADLERSARLHTADPLTVTAFVEHMRAQAQEWTEAEQQRLRLLFPLLNRFLAGIKNLPPVITLIKASPLLEDGMPHTRANAIVLPAGMLRQPPGALARLMAHEVFHVLSRSNPALRERLYQSIGFKPCTRIEIPEKVNRIRISNPDAVESRHTIAVRYQGKPVEALPFIRFGSADADPRGGFASQIEVAWLLVEREGTTCKALPGRRDELGIAPERFEGLREQIGENTAYLFHPEEILADNFAILFLNHAGGKPLPAPSPQILERLHGILFE